MQYILYTFCQLVDPCCFVHQPSYQNYLSITDDAEKFRRSRVSYHFHRYDLGRSVSIGYKHGFFHGVLKVLIAFRDSTY